MERSKRKLAAIMFTDISGYTAQMSKDEVVAISLLSKKESILKENPFLKESFFHVPQPGIC